MSAVNGPHGPPSLMSRPPQIQGRQIYSRFVIAMTAIAAIVAVGALVLVLGYLVINGFRSISPAIFTRGPVPEGEAGGGLKNGIVGTLILLGLAGAIGIPIGILGGIYQVESRSRFAWWVGFFADVLNSIPSIVIGIFAYIVVVLPTHHFSAYAGGFALGILMLPTVMRTTEEILRLVPMTLREGSLALGATRWRTMWSVVLPTARSGIITGVMLAMARIAGETAPLLFTAYGNTVFTTKLSGAIDALPINIYNDATSAYPVDNHLAAAGAMILVTLIFIMSLLTRYLSRNQMGESK